MFKKFAVFIVSLPALGVAAAAMAQQTGQTPDAGENPFTNQGAVQSDAFPKAPVKPEGLRLSIDRDTCRRIARPHRPAGDVAYREGVDVRGKPVAPADLPGSYRFQTPETIEFDLAFNPLANTAVDREAFANTGTAIARVAVDVATGEVRIDGKTVGPEGETAILERCRAAGFIE